MASSKPIKYSTFKADDFVDIRMGPGAASTAPFTVMQKFKETATKHATLPALHVQRKLPEPEGKNEYSEDWTVWTWSAYYNDTIKFAKALVKLDFAPHKCINIIGFNSPEWVIANMGGIAAGGISAGIYTTNNAEACHYISEHSEAEVIVLEDIKQLKKYQTIAEKLPKLKAVVMWTGGFPPDVTFPARVKLFTWDGFLQSGADVPDAKIDERIADQKPNECCTLIYTSGTTGPPKAVMISNDNLTWTTATYLDSMPVKFNENDRAISYLPLSHVAAQMLDIHCPLHRGLKIYFARPDALKGSLKDTLIKVRPTYFFGVPRIWEKFYEALMAIGRQTTGVKKTISTWAKSKGAARTELLQYPTTTETKHGGYPSMYGCANKIILSKIKGALGLDQCKVCFTAAAPISIDILNYFGSLDIAVYEVFGQSECTGPHTSNFPGQWKKGSIGRVLPGTQTKVDPVTQEFVYTGRHVFMGYLKMADKTTETIDSEGWLHSGDVASVDEHGFWKITGRIKELIITGGGENIPPVLIEDEIKRQLPALSNVMVIGDKRKFLTCIVTLKTELDSDGSPLSKIISDSARIVAEFGSPAKTWEEARDCEKWKKYITDGINRANNNATSSAQTIKKFVMTADFSEKGGELTPTLKLKRSVAAAKHSVVIESMYAGSAGLD